MRRYQITVQLKPEVLDPEGRAIAQTVQRLGIEGVNGVSVQKRYVVCLDDEMSADRAEQTARRMAQELLANPVSQDFSVECLDD